MSGPNAEGLPVGGWPPEGLVTAALLNRAVDAAFPGLPECMSLLEARRRTAAALNAVAADLYEAGAVAMYYEALHGLDSLRPARQRSDKDTS